MSTDQGTPPPSGPDGYSDEELRAAYEAELARIRVDDVLIQTVVSLLNLGARRAALTGPAGEEQRIDAALDGPNGAQRQRAAHRAGAALREVYAETVRETTTTYAQEVPA